MGAYIDDAVLAIKDFTTTHRDSPVTFVLRDGVQGTFNAIGLGNAAQENQSCYCLYGRVKCALLVGAGTAFILVGPIIFLAFGIFTMWWQATQIRGSNWREAVAEYSPDMLLAMPICVVTGVFLVVLGSVGTVIHPSFAMPYFVQEFIRV